MKLVLCHGVSELLSSRRSIGPSMPAPPQDQVAILLDRFPGPQTLPRSTSNWLRILAIGIAFVALGVVFIRTPLTFSGDSRVNGSTRSRRYYSYNSNGYRQRCGQKYTIESQDR